MANAFSIIHKQQPYIQAVNVSDIEKTMAVKQNNFDYNMAQVNQAISQFSSIDLIRDQDKLHLYQNMKKVLDIVGNTDNIDFSKTGVGSELSTYISKAIDRDVIKQAGNTQKIRKFNAKMEEMQQKNPELYNAQNEHDAKEQAGLNQYMSGEREDLGSLNYTPYKDVNGDLLKYAKELKDLYPDHEVEFPDPLNPGYMKKTKVSELNSAEWQTFLTQRLSPHDRAQMAINGRAMFGYDDERAKTRLKEFQSGIEDKYNSQIKDLKFKLSGDNLDERSKKLYEEQIGQLETNRDTSINNLNKMKTAGEIGGYLIEQSMIDPMATALGRKFELGLSTDSAYFARLKAMEAERKAAAEAGSTGDHMYTITAPVDTENIGSGLNRFYEGRETVEGEIDSLQKSFYRELEAEDSDFIEEAKRIITEEYKEENNGEEPSEYVLTRAVVDRAIEMEKISPDKVLTLRDKLDQREAYVRAEEKAVDNTLEQELYEGIEEQFKTMTSGWNDFLFFDKEGKETTFKKHLEEKGIKTVEEYKNFLSSSDSDLFKYNYILHYVANDTGSFMNTARQWFDAGRMVSPLSPIPSLGQPNYEKETLAMVNKANKIAEKIGMSTLATDMGLPTTQLKKVGATANMTTGSPNYVDKVLSTDSTFKSQFKTKNRKRKFEENLNISSAQISGQNIIVIEGKGSGKYQPQAHKEAVALASQYIEIKREDPVRLQKDGKGGVWVLQTETKLDSKDREVVVYQKKGHIAASDINARNTPALYQAIDFTDQESSIDFLDITQTKTGPISYTSNKPKMVEGLSNIMSKYGQSGGKIMQMASKENAYRYINDELYRRGGDGYQGQRELMSTIDEAIKNSNKFYMEVEKGSTTANIVVKMMGKKGVGDYEVAKIPVYNTSDAGAFKDIYYGAPQVYLTQALYELGLDFQTYGKNDAIEEIKKRL